MTMANQHSRTAASNPPIPITVVTGFLGAGKTTLLNHILTAEHGRHIGVLVNDFGSINIDAEMIAKVDEGMIGLANGCICCSIRVDLIQAVLLLAKLPARLDHIVIEASGVADPAGIIRSFLEPGIWGIAQLDAVVTVVDAEQTPALPEEEQRLAQCQVTGADLIVLNKVDLVDESGLTRAHEWINGIRPGVQVFETSQCRLPMKILLGIGGSTGAFPPLADAPHVHVRQVGTSADGSHRDHEDHGEHGLMFDTWAFTSQAPLQLSRFQELLGSLPRALFRVKGFIHAVEHRGKLLVLNMVGRRAMLSFSGAWENEQPQTRLVFISRHDSVNYSDLEQAMKGCVLPSATGSAPDTRDAG